MSTNKQIRDTICDTLAAVGGLNVYPYPVDNVTAPCAVLTDLESKITTVDGGRDVTATVTVLVAHNNPEQMTLLDDLVDPNIEGSIPDTLEELRGTIELAVTGIGSFGARVVAEIPYYGAAVTMQVVD